jgi:hypothetical protein
MATLIDPNNKSIRLAARITLFALAVLLVFSGYFYIERMLFSDAAHIFTTIVNTKRLSIIENRFGSFITQLFPLVGVWLKLPLKTLLFIYSVSFNTFFLASGFMLYRWRQYGLVLLLGLYLTACATETFYWSNNEVHQGVCWMLLAFGYLFYCVENGRSRLKMFIPFTLLIFLALFSHPLVIIVTTYLFVFFLLDKRLLHAGKRTLVLALIILFIVFLKVYASSTGFYDKGLVTGLIESFSMDKVLGFFKTSTAREFFKSTVQDYWQFLILFLWGIGATLLSRKPLILIWVVISMLGYFTLVCLMYPVCDLKFYIESEWMPMTILALIPFVWFGLPRLNIGFAGLLILTFFTMRLVQISNSCGKFQGRIKEIRRITTLLQEKNIPKGMIERHQNDAIHNTLMMSWGLPYETMILSGIDGKNKPVTALLLFEDEIKGKLARITEKDFVSPFWEQSYTKLNARYFSIDTVRPYVVLDDSFGVNTRYYTKESK